MNKQTISMAQFTFFIIQTQVGVGILSLPFAIFNGGAKTDGWISVLLAGLFIQGVIFICWLLSKHHPGLPFSEILTTLFGKIIGKSILFLYIIYFILVSTTILSLFYQIIRDWALPNTPSWFIGLLISLPIFYLIIDKLRVIVRFHVLSSFYIILLVFFTLPAYTHVDIRFLLPIGENGLLNILKGTKESLLSMLGFELILFIFPFVQGSEKQKLVSASVANGIVTLLYTYLTFLTYIFFHPEEIPLVPEPVLYLLKAFSFTIVERVDIVFLTIWLISVITSLMSYIYVNSFSFAYFLKNNRKHHSYVLYMLGIPYVLSILPNSVYMNEKLGSIVGNLGLLFAICIPILSYIISALFYKRGKKEHSL